MFCKYVLINYIAEKERSHDADVTGRVSATWTHFSRFGNATGGVSLGKTVCRLLVESLSSRSFFSKFKATVISASNSVFMPHGSAYTDSKGRILAKVRNFGLLGQRTDETEPTTANDSFEKRRLSSLRIRSRIGMKNSTRMASDVTTS